MSGEELYNADVAKHPTYITTKPRTPWEKLSPIFRKSWEQKAAELTPPCDFCGKPGYADTPCPVRHESAAKYAEEGRKAYASATGIEAEVCESIRRTIQPEMAERLCSEIALRQRLGVQKYGTTLANNPAALKARLRHALEEALDLSVYLMWAHKLTEADVHKAMIDEMIPDATFCAAKLVLMIDEATEGGQP